MACSRSTPPSSPRAPKIQQQSWDDCGTPPIDLFDPNDPGPMTNDSTKSQASHNSPLDTPKSIR